VYYSFWAGVPTRFEAYGAAGRWAGSVPTNDGLSLVAAYFPQARFGAIRPDAARAHRDGIRAVAPDLAGRLDAGTQVERLYGTGEQRNFFRQAAGPGWALVGDAGHHKDSITARGITDAFRQAGLLADCLGDGVRDEDRLRTGLRRYATARNRAMLDGYRDTLAAGELRPERRLASLRAIAADPALVERFFARLAGACPVGGTGSPGPARVRPHPRRTAWTGPSTST
jgi:flavin-dependent dehydrogenase